MGAEGHPGQPLDLLIQKGVELLRKRKLFQPVAVVLRQSHIGILLAQFVLQDLDLLAHIVIPLIFIDLLFELFADFLVDLQNFQLGLQKCKKALGALDDLHAFQNLLFFRVVERDVAGNEIAENRQILFLKNPQRDL